MNDKFLNVKDFEELQEYEKQHIEHQNFLQKYKDYDWSKVRHIPLKQDDIVYGKEIKFRIPKYGDLSLMRNN